MSTELESRPCCHIIVLGVDALDNLPGVNVTIMPRCLLLRLCSMMPTAVAGRAAASNVRNM